MTPRPRIQVAVVMERVAAPNPWESWQFRLADVVPDEGIFGACPRRLVGDDKFSRWLFPGFTIELFADECKGYYLNLTSGRPCWFVSWVIDAADPSLPTLTGVGVSYVEADRRMASEEHVETVALAPELCEWLQQFTNEHFRPEVRRKVRAQSFLSPEERERHQARSEPAAAGLPPPGPSVPGDESHDQERARNAALRELFHGDPHFRRSDGLDVGVDEVHEIEGSPTGRQRKILQARTLGLLDDELLDQEPPSQPRSGH
jgi:hypothetical protein